ncbi:hypothetical protein D3C81_1746960 [compost metagenome]
MSAIQQAFVMNRRQNVPHALNVVVVESDIWIVKISPVSNRFCKFTPLLLITEDTCFTLLNEFLDSIFLDLLLT